ncbi:MAG TPA: biosynthetic-type acetolactate synthase large subunit [Candidatus Latescibacteria bacterium]|nr:biosynthetic-type acetolactate synthase large subunit [Candidatus Latescibacterota bacterium]
MELTGAEILIESLKREGVDILFGIPGGAVISIFDRLYDEKEIRFILVRHEQAAAHAADGYARASGKTGVCIATSGPGATNLVTGIATAYMDSVPLVALTGQVGTPMIGSDAFQEADITGITRPITKHSYLVKDVRNLARSVKEAFHIASTGRPGPVLIDLPVDIVRASTDFTYPEKAEIRGYRPNYDGHPRQIKKVAEAITEAKRPVICAGGGVIISGAAKELRELAEKVQTPVITTLLGLGAFPSDHPLSLGMPGMHGTYYANIAITECDLLISIGARFDDRVTGKVEAFAPHAKIVHIDIDPAAISKNVAVDIPVVGDAKRILVELNRIVKKKERSEWNERLDFLKRKYPLQYEKSDKVIKPQYVVEQIYEATKGEAIITTEVGQNQMWAAQYFKYSKPRSYISSGGLGTMGYGFPAAIGAQIARPDAIVFDIAGDGSFQMNIQELATVVQYKLPVKVAILNNRFLGMVRQWQELFFNKRYSATFFEALPDFAKVAEAYGVKGLSITDPKDVRAAIEEAISTDGPVVLDFHVDWEEKVFPMVPAGKAINEMIERMA